MSTSIDHKVLLYCISLASGEEKLKRVNPRLPETLRLHSIWDYIDSATLYNTEINMYRPQQGTRILHMFFKLLVLEGNFQGANSTCLGSGLGYQSTYRDISYLTRTVDS